MQGLFKDPEIVFSRTNSEVYRMDSITAIFNIYFCDYGAVLVYKNKT